MIYDEQDAQNPKVVANHEQQYSIWPEQQQGGATYLTDLTLEYVKLRSQGTVGTVVTFCMLGTGVGEKASRENDL